MKNHRLTIDVLLRRVERWLRRLRRFAGIVLSIVAFLYRIWTILDKFAGGGPLS
jgi:hypothetical protein